LSFKSKSTDLIQDHYQRPEIKNKILEFCDSRRALNGDMIKWYHYEDNSTRSLLSSDNHYDEITSNHRTLYATLDLFDKEIFNKKQEYESSIDKKNVSKDGSVLGTLEDCEAYSLGIDIDTMDTEEGDITKSKRLRLGIENALAFLLKKFKNIGVEKSIHILYSGGGAYFILHHELFKSPENLTGNERAGIFKKVHTTFNLFIIDLLKEFQQIYPQYDGMIKFDALNNQKRVFKTIYSIHKKLNLAVIPLDKNNLHLDISKAKLPISDEIIELGKSWYKDYDFSESEAILKALTKYDKIAKIKLEKMNIKYDNRNKKKEFRSYNKIKPTEFCPWLIALLNRARSTSAGKTRVIAGIATMLPHAGYSDEESIRIAMDMANDAGLGERIDLVTDHVYNINAPSCHKIQSAGSHYPNLGYGDLDCKCVPNETCAKRKCEFPFHYWMEGREENVIEQKTKIPPLKKPIDNIKIENTDPKKKPSQAEKLITLADENNVEFWHTPDHEQYATVVENGHNENMAIKSSSFKRWLSWKMFSGEDGKVPGSQALQDAINTMGGKAEFLGEELATFVRVAEKDGKIYVDMGDVDWNAIEISGGTWKMVTNPPVKFVRPKGLLPLVVPERGGNIDDLRCLLNAGDDDTWMLIVAWMLQAFWPRGPYAHLSLGGEQGTLKSTMTRMIKMIIDPSTTALRRMPKNEEDMMIAAKRERVLSFDNLSGISHEMSDSLCCLSTGGSLGKRALYENDEEHSITAMRPAIMNGIDALTSRGDLIDRTIIIDLPVVDKKNRKSVEDIDEKFNKIRPKILGALLDITAKGWDTKIGTIENLPRMADFARWVLACEPHLPWKKGRFLKVYHESKCNAIGDSISGNKFAMAIKDYTGKHFANPDKVTNIIPTILFKNLCEQEGFSSNFIPKGIGWPSSPSAMSKLLNRMSAGLRQQKVVVTQYKSDGVRYINLACREKSHQK
jgi:hypothetical protein